jgi:chondroitin AC lyase
LTRFVVNGWQWMCRGINTVPGTVDRSVTRKNSLHAADISDLLPELARLDPENASTLNAFARTQRGDVNHLTGFRYFPYSDFAAYQCEEFSFFLKTISTRTLPAESINGENLKGHLLNSGDACLIHDGNEYFNLMPVWNWDALPGITTFTGADKIIRKPFNGSVTDSTSGLTAMNYEIAGQDTSEKVYAHKIWACHDNIVVCLIAGLTAKNVRGNVYTVLDQSRWRGPVAENRPSNILKQGEHILQNVKWIYHAGFSYLPASGAGTPLKPSEIRLLMDTVSGTWASVNASAPGTTVTDSVFMPAIIHGEYPEHLSTGYVVAFGGTAEETEALAGHPVWKIRRNDDTCQAVQFADGTLMAAFFSPGMLRLSAEDQLQVSRPCLVLLPAGDTGEQRRKIYLSDPLHKGGILDIGVDQREKKVVLPDDGTTTLASLPQ